MYPKKGAVLEAKEERKTKERHVIIAGSEPELMDRKESYKTFRTSPSFKVMYQILCL
jgi:hypothetical protein